MNWYFGNWKKIEMEARTISIAVVGSFGELGTRILFKVCQ
jgi:hypothetical protein